MSLRFSNVFTYDDDAGTYIQAVEAADGQALEAKTRLAINDFVIGCKQDGIWNAIKASCILAGARTLAGALVPLRGAAPTNVNFVAGDYNRKTGLVGDGSTKYLDSNYAYAVGNLSSHHIAVYSTGSVSSTMHFAGLDEVNKRLRIGFATNTFFTSANNTTVFSGSLSVAGTIGLSRGSASSFDRFDNKTAVTVSANSSSAISPVNSYIYTTNTGANSPQTFYSTARLAFYSIGESLGLARLDSRVTDLINRFAAVIP